MMRLKNKSLCLVICLILFMCVTGCITPSGGIIEPEADATPPPPVLVPSAVPEKTPDPVNIPEPLPELSPPPEPPPKDYAILKGLLDEFIAGQSGTYGIAFINLVTGEAFGLNDTKVYIAASTSKLVINLFLFESIAKGAIDPQSILTYEEVDFEQGAGIIQREEYGTEYTVLETARLSIIHSDNCAINMIIRLLGKNQVVQYMLDLGGSINYSGYRSSPRDMAIYASHLYHFYLEEPEVAGILMKYLESTPFNDRIRKLLPEDVRVAHKIGNFDRTANDVGIVFASEPYVISMMSDDVDFLEGCKVLAQMSKMVYDFMEDTVMAR